MITFFTTPKAFKGLSDTHQRNAIGSWRAIGPDVEIMLFGNDPGVAEAAQEFGCIYHPDVPCTRYGTPFLRPLFELASARAKFPVLIYVNADIIMTRRLRRFIPLLETEQNFLVCGSRIDLDVSEMIDWSDPVEAGLRLLAEAKRHGRQHGPSGSDYFIFKRGTLELPEFVVGRPCWDNWLIYHARSRGWLVVDGSSAIPIVHQNHDYGHTEFGRAKRTIGPEFTHNIQVAGGYHRMLDLRSADWVLTEHGIRRSAASRRVTAALMSAAPMRHLLALKRQAWDAYLLRAGVGA